MKIRLKCLCGTELMCSTDPYYTKEGDVLITTNKCKVCDENSYHEGLVRGSQLKTPLQLNGESMEDYGRRLREFKKGDANDKETQIKET